MRQAGRALPSHDVPTPYLVSPKKFVTQNQIGTLFGVETRHFRARKALTFAQRWRLQAGVMPKDLSKEPVE